MIVKSKEASLAAGVLDVTADTGITVRIEETPDTVPCYDGVLTITESTVLAAGGGNINTPLSMYAYKATCKVPSALVPGSANLEFFPLLVRLGENFVLRKTGVNDPPEAVTVGENVFVNNGAMHFLMQVISSDGVRLPYVVIHKDLDNGAIYLYINITLKKNEDTEFYIYYGLRTVRALGDRPQKVFGAAGYRNVVIGGMQLFPAIQPIALSGKANVNTQEVEEGTDDTPYIQVPTAPWCYGIRMGNRCYEAGLKGAWDNSNPRRLMWYTSVPMTTQQWAGVGASGMASQSGKWVDTLPGSVTVMFYSYRTGKHQYAPIPIYTLGEPSTEAAKETKSASVCCSPCMEEESNSCDYYPSNRQSPTNAATLSSEDGIDKIMASIAVGGPLCSKKLFNTVAATMSCSFQMYNSNYGWVFDASAINSNMTLNGGVNDITAAKYCGMVHVKINAYDEQTGIATYMAFQTNTLVNTSTFVPSVFGIPATNTAGLQIQRALGKWVREKVIIRDGVAKSATKENNLGDGIPQLVRCPSVVLGVWYSERVQTTDWVAAQALNMMRVEFSAPGEAFVETTIGYNYQA